MQRRSSVCLFVCLSVCRQIADLFSLLVENDMQNMLCAYRQIFTTVLVVYTGFADV